MGLILNHMSASNGASDGYINVTGSFALFSGSNGHSTSGGFIDLPQVAMQDTPDNARGYLYVASSSATPANSSLWFKNDDGTDTDLIGAGNVDGTGAATRVAFWSDSDTITSDSDMTFATDTLTVTKLGAYEQAGAVDFSDEAMTNVNIDSGAIDGAVIGANNPEAGSFDAVVGTTGVYSGILKTDDTTDATTNADGSLQTDGGLSVAKAIFNSTAATLAAASGVVTMGSTTGATVSAAGILNVNNSTEATSATDGSLQTDGGLSVVKSAVIGDDLDLLSDGAIMNIGSTSKFTLTDQSANNCVMAASGARLAFGNAGEYISGDGTDLKIVSSNDIDVTGDLDVVGGVTSTLVSTLASASGVTTIGSSTAAVFTAAGILNVNNATEATSATDGSLQTDGGLSVVKSAVIGDDLDLLSDSAVLTIGSTSKFALTDQAANNCVMATPNHRLAFGSGSEYISGDGTDLKVVSSGDVDITATLVDVTGAGAFSGNLTVGGNLDVNGTTTTIDTANLSVQDSIIALGVSGSDGGYSTSGDRGILFPRGEDFSATAGLKWDGTRFSLGQSLTGPTSGSFSTMTSYDKVMMGRLEIDSVADYIDVSTDLQIVAAADVEINAGGGNVKPSANDGSALGVSGTAWSDLFLASGAVVDFNASDVTLTHSANTLTVAGGTLATAALTTSTIVASGIVKTDNTTDATTNADGSLQTDGGLSVAKAIFNSTAATLAAVSGVVTMGSTTGATVSAAGILNVNNSTEATSATDGSLQTDGGLSVVKSAVIGDDLDLLSDSAILTIGSTSKFALTDQAANNCVMATSGHRLAFGDAGEYITGDGTDLSVISSADIILDPGGNNVLPGSDSADSLGASATAWANLFVDAIDLNGQGNISMGGTGRIDLDALDRTSIRSNAQDTITIEIGGVDLLAITGSAGDPTIGVAVNNADLKFGGVDGGANIVALTLDMSEEGFAVFNAGLSAAGNVVMGEDSSVLSMGDGADVTFTHDGTTGLTIAATPITVNSVGALTLDSTTDIVLDADGDEITFKAGAADTDGLGFTHSNTGDWTIDIGASDKDMIFSVNDGGSATEVFRLDGDVSAMLMASGKHLRFGAAEEYIYGDGSHLYLESDGNIQIGCDALIPDVDNDTNLGSASKRFANIYTGDLHLANDRGNWTLVEESDMLTFRNNKNGKWFRMVMEEIDGDGREAGMQGAPPAGGIEWEV